MLRGIQVGWMFQQYTFVRLKSGNYNTVRNNCKISQKCLAWNENYIKNEYSTKFWKNKWKLKKNKINTKKLN